MMKKKIYILLLITLTIVINTSASDFLIKADSAYKAADYKTAIELYERTIKEKNATSELYYNLGNAYYKDDNFGKAIVCYSRSLKYDPSNKHAKNNIEFIRSKVADLNSTALKGEKIDIMADEPTFFEKIYNAICKDIHSDVWAIWSAITFILLIITISLYVFVNNVLIRKIGFFGGIFMIVLTMILLLFSFMSAREYEKQDKGVIISFSSPLKSEAKESSEEVTIPFHRGTEFDIIEEYLDVNNEKWYKIRINKNIAGWINQKDIEVI